MYFGSLPWKKFSDFARKGSRQAVVWQIRLATIVQISQAIGLCRETNTAEF